MAWGDNGATLLRKQLDQAYTFAWGAQQVRMQTQALNNTGILSRLKLKVPLAGGALSIGAAGISVAPQTSLNRPAHRALQSFLLQAQGVAAFLQLNRGGLDAAILEYMNVGERPFLDASLGSLPDLPPGGGGAVLNGVGRASVNPKNYAYNVETGVVAGAAPAQTQNVSIAGHWEFPITEWVSYPARVVKGQNGVVTVPPQVAEIGLLILQNVGQNFTPSVSFNPLYTGTAGSPLVQSGGAPTGSIPAAAELHSEFYDLPDNPADLPPAFTRAFIVTKTSSDDGVAGGNAKHTFTQAGLLLRAAYVFLDANDNIVDIMGPTTPNLGAYPLPAAANEPTINFLWGSAVFKYRERASLNLANAFRMYGDPPPVGCLFHDFFRDHSLTEVINTAQLPNVRTEISGLPGNVVTMHTIEERLVPVKYSG